MGKCPLTISMKGLFDKGLWHHCWWWALQILQIWETTICLWPECLWPYICEYIECEFASDMFVQVYMFASDLCVCYTSLEVICVRVFRCDMFACLHVTLMRECTCLQVTRMCVYTRVAPRRCPTHPPPIHSSGPVGRGRGPDYNLIYWAKLWGTDRGPLADGLPPHTQRFLSTSVFSRSLFIQQKIAPLPWPRSPPDGSDNVLISSAAKVSLSRPIKGKPGLRPQRREASALSCLEATFYSADKMVKKNYLPVDKRYLSTL